jgi:MFS family permease
MAMLTNLLCEILSDVTPAVASLTYLLSMIVKRLFTFGHFVLQFDLVCDRERLLPLISSLFMIGVFVGAFVSGSISDRFVTFNALKKTKYRSSTKIQFRTPRKRTEIIWRCRLCRERLGTMIIHYSKLVS